MDAIAAMMGSVGDGDGGARGSEGASASADASGPSGEAEVQFPSGSAAVPIPAARQNRGGGGGGNGSKGSHGNHEQEYLASSLIVDDDGDSDDSSTGQPPSELQVTLRGLRKQSAGADAFDQLLAEQEGEVGPAAPRRRPSTGKSRPNSGGGGGNVSARRPDRLTSSTPGVAPIMEEVETTEEVPAQQQQQQLDSNHRRSPSATESAESPVPRALSAANLANHDQRFGRARSSLATIGGDVDLESGAANDVGAAAAAASPPPGSPPAPAPRSSSREFENRPVPLSPNNDDDNGSGHAVSLPERAWSRDTDNATESSWGGNSTLSSRPNTGQSLLNFSRPGTGHESMPGTPLSPMTPYTGVGSGGRGGGGGGADGRGGAVPVLALSPLHPGAAWEPLDDATRQIEREWAEGRWGGIPLPTIPSMSVEQLDARKRVYKHALRKFETRFAERNGHPPSKDEKRPLKTTYRMHKDLRSELAARAKAGNK